MAGVLFQGNFLTSLYQRILLSLLLIISVLGTVSACYAETLSDLFKKAHIIPVQKAKAVHDFVLPDINGNQHRLQDFQGKIVLLNIWAMWCAPCRQEMPSMEKLHQHFKEQDFAILAVSVDMSDTELVKAFVEKHNYTFTILHDPRGNVMEWFRVRLIPVTYLINRSGKIIGKAVGLRDWSHEHVIRLCEELLKETDKRP